MDIDNMINNAFAEVVPGEGYFMVEGNPTTNDIRILPADKAMNDNLVCFAWSVDLGYQYLGLFTDEKTAQRQIAIIRSKIRDEAGNTLLRTSLALSEAGLELLMYKKLWLVDVHPSANEVRLSVEADVVISNIEAFAAGEHTGYQFVCLVVDEAAAKEIERRIRTRVRDEAGTRLAFDSTIRKDGE